MRRRSCRSRTALARLPAEAVARVPDEIRASRARARDRLRREGRPRPVGARAPAARGRDRHLRRRARGPPLGRAHRDRGRAAAHGRHVSPASARGARQPGLAARDARRRLELLAELGVEETLVVEFTPELAALEPEEFVASYLAAIGAETVVCGEGFRFGRSRRGDLAPARAARDRDARGAARRGRLVDGDPPARRRGRRARRGGMLGRPVEIEGVVVSGEARGGTLGFPTANLADRADPARAALRDLCRLGTRGRAPRCRSA